MDYDGVGYTGSRNDVQVNPQYNYYTRPDDLRYEGPRPFASASAYTTPPENDGGNDADKNPFQFVLVRHLKESVTEDVFAKGLEKLYRGVDETPGGAIDKSIRRVMLVRDRETNESMCYGFAEYHKQGDAEDAVTKSYKIGDKLTISSKKFSIDYTHSGVFPPAMVGTQEFNDRFTIKMARSQSGGRHKYYDHRYYLSELIVNPEPPSRPSGPPKHSSDFEKNAKKPGVQTLESKSKKRKAPGTTAPRAFQHWQNMQIELHGEEESGKRGEPKQPATGVNAIETPDVMSDVTSLEQTFVYDGTSIACHLCSRTFETREKVILHLNESKLHAKNLKDEAVVKEAYQRLEQNGIDAVSTFQLPSVPAVKPPGMEPIDQPGQYRDRAKERRQEEAKTGPVDKVGFSIKGAASRKKGAGAAGSPSSSDNENSKPAYGKGMGMLQRAGWEEGQGLGSQGGATAPIDQSVYAAGVGLGHEGSKKGDAVEEAERMTRGDGFAERTKEIARRRYEQMR